MLRELWDSVVVFLTCLFKGHRWWGRDWNRVCRRCGKCEDY